MYNTTKKILMYWWLKCKMIEVFAILQYQQKKYQIMILLLYILTTIQLLANFDGLLLLTLM